MLRMILKLILTALALIVTAYILPGFNVDSFGTALVAAIVFALVNLFIKPLMTIITLPLNIVTLGLFTFVINAAMLALVAALVDGFEITNFFSALIGAIVLSLISTVLTDLAEPEA